MTEHDDIPYRWKIGVLVIILLLLLTGFVAVQWLLLSQSNCTSEAHFVDICDPYLPHVPGKEGR